MSSPDGFIAAAPAEEECSVDSNVDIGTTVADAANFPSETSQPSPDQTYVQPSQDSIDTTPSKISFEGTSGNQTMGMVAVSSEHVCFFVLHRQKLKRKSKCSEFLALSEITFEWSDSYDNKDWARLRTILAPSLMVRS